MWITMHKKGVVKDPSERTLHNYVYGMTTVGRLEWCKSWQKSKVIEPLKEWQLREDVKKLKRVC